MATAELIERRDGSAQDQANAISSLPPNLAILKMENENIMSLAAAHPRDMKQIKRDLQETLDAFPQLAEDAIYNKPVGTVSLIDCHCGNQYESATTKADDMQCPKCRKVNVRHQRKIKKFARGLSIKAAETLAEVYGFNRIRTDVTEINDDKVKLEVTFTDYQRGRIWQDSGIVSKFYKGYGGQMQRTPDDRFYNVTLKAEKSKYIREAINRSVNAGLKAWFWGECERIQDTLLDDATIDKIVTNFATKNVSLEMLERLVGRSKLSGWTTEDRKNLAGAWTALKDGETTVSELFADEEPTPKPAATGPVTADNFTAPKAAPKATEKPKTEQQSTPESVAPAAGSLLLHALDEAKSAEEIHSILEDVACGLAEKRLPADEAAGLKEYGREKLHALTAHDESEGDQSSEDRFERLKDLFARATTDEQRMAAWKGSVVAANDKHVSPEQYKLLVSLNSETRKRLGSSAR